jgi:hypothetical protein
MAPRMLVLPGRVIVRGSTAASTGAVSGLFTHQAGS